jgi:2-polyprenyl-6-methoxyphenol hydroxylase-like FAD-dependent oxidoreductase
MLAETHAAAYVGNQLHMLVGNNGYAGICSTDGSCVDIAAAIDPASIQTLGGIEQVVGGILEECNAPRIQWPEFSPWMATPALTRNSSRVVDRCVFLIGDAIGYVEPFTGEGMSWALASAEAVMPHVIEIAHKEWNDRMADQWSDWAVRQRIHKQKTCRWIASRIRRPRGAAWVLQACDWFPPLRATIIRKTTQ